MALDLGSLPDRPEPVITWPRMYNPHPRRTSALVAAGLSVLAIVVLVVGVKTGFVGGRGAAEYPLWVDGLILGMVAALVWRAVSFRAQLPWRMWSLLEAWEREEGFDLVRESHYLAGPGRDPDPLFVGRGETLILTVERGGEQPSGPRGSRAPSHRFTVEGLRGQRSDIHPVELGEVSIERLRALARRYGVALRLRGEAGSLAEREEDTLRRGGEPARGTRRDIP